MDSTAAPGGRSPGIYSLKLSDSSHSWTLLGDTACEKQRPVIHTIRYYIQTFTFGAFFFFLKTCQILTPLKKKSINPCCALNTKRTRNSAVCEFNCSYSGLPQQFSFWIFLLEVSLKHGGEILPSTESAVGAQRLLYALLGNEDENGTQDLQKGWFLCSYSGSPFVCQRCIMFEMLTTILYYYPSPSLTFVLRL